MTPTDDLHDAIRAGDDARALRLLRDDPGLARARGRDGLSPLMAASYRRRDAVIEALRAIGPPLDACEAASVGDAHALASLLAADPGAAHARHVDGFAALHLAAFFGRPDCVAALLRAGADPDVVADNPSRVRPLHSALAGRDVACVRALVAAGAAVDAAQAGGWTALMAAARHGDLASLEALLEAGADRSLRADDGRTAQDLAREAGQDGAVERLAAR